MAYWPTPPAATYWSRERRLTTATNATRCRLHPNHRPRNEEIIMSTDSNLPMDLYKANVQLWMNMGLLLQEVRQQWAELGDKRLGDDIEETRKELEELAGVHGRTELATLPGRHPRRDRTSVVEGTGGDVTIDVRWVRYEKH